jgi:1-acyl-sn-glycerol-3-phosphate acyltransferase
MRQAIESIRSGRRVLIFAEGTRSADGSLQRFKKGAFHLAVDAQVPILPVAINGSFTLLPKGQSAVRPGVVDVVVCDPIPTAGLGKDDIPRLMEETREAILAARRLDPDFRE